MLRTFCALGALAAASAISQAATFTFASDPFAGSTALTTPGRQVVGGEAPINFDIATDQLAFDPAFFNFGPQLNFANDVAGNLPTSNANFIVLRTFDNDNDATTPFGAGNAANLIADRVTSDGPGFFIYFNSGLNLARLVYSTNLSDNTSDLKILARFPNITGQAGRDAFPALTAANVTATPEPASLLLTAAALASLAVRKQNKRLTP